MRACEGCFATSGTLYTAPCGHRSHAECGGAVCSHCSSGVAQRLVRNLIHGASFNITPLFSAFPIDALARTAVSLDGLALQHVTAPSLELCRIAHRQNPAAIRWVPEQHVGRLLE